MSAKLYLMLGYPGAGKTTTAHILSELTGAVRLSSDEFRFAMFPQPTFSEAEHTTLYRTLDFVTEMLLRSGVSVIYDANLNRYQHRAEKYDICARTGAEAVVVWLQTERELAKQRAIHEDRAHFAPKDETLDNMFERITGVFEAPHAEEPVLVVNGRDVTGNSLQQLLVVHNLV